MNMPDWNQAKAAGRHLASYAAGGVTVAVAWGLLSSGQGSDISADITLISDGVGQVVKGIAGIAGTLTPIYMAWRAAHSASPAQQAQSLAQQVPGTIVVTSPAVAAAVPSENVVSNTDSKVVSK